MAISAWFTFFFMMTLIAYTPGPMTMFSMSSSLRNGFYQSLPGIFGGSVSYMLQMVIVYLGLGIVVQNSSMAFNAIKWVGVTYLIILGLKNWRASVNQSDLLENNSSVNPVKQFWLGFATGMSNPKSILVFTVLFPQFIVPQHYTSHFLILSVSFFFIQGSSALMYALFGAKFFLWMRGKGMEKLQNKMTAGILFAAGGILALSEK